MLGISADCFYSTGIYTDIVQVYILTTCNTNRKAMYSLSVILPLSSACFSPSIVDWPHFVPWLSISTGRQNSLPFQR